MKLKKLIPAIGTIVLLLTTACHNNIGPHDPDSGNCVTIIKFHKSEYKEHVMVYALDPAKYSTTSLCTDHICLPDSIIHICGKSPYIELPDDYLLIDWKWKRLYYQNNEAIINTKWSDLKDEHTRFPTSEIIVMYPVAEFYHFSISTLREYNNGYLESDDPNSYNGDPACPCYTDDDWNRLSPEHEMRVLKYAEQYDNAQIEYAEILKRMIEEGNLPQKVNLRHKKPYEPK